MFTLESSLPPPPSSWLQPPAAVYSPAACHANCAIHKLCWLDATCCLCFCFLVSFCVGGAERGLGGRRTHLSREIDVQFWVLWLFVFCFADCLLWDVLLPRQSEERKQRNAERHLLAALLTVFRTELVTKALNWNLADWLLLQLFPPWLSSRLLFSFSVV